MADPEPWESDHEKFQVHTTIRYSGVTFVELMLWRGHATWEELVGAFRVGFCGVSRDKLRVRSSRAGHERQAFPSSFPCLAMRNIAAH